MLSIERFFEKIRTGLGEEAIDELLSSNPNIDLKDSSTQVLKTTFLEFNNHSGPFYGKTLLKKRYVESDIAIYSYLAKYETRYLRYNFIYYNNGKVVRLYKFHLDDIINLELEESIKMYTE